MKVGDSDLIVIAVEKLALRIMLHRLRSAHYPQSWKRRIARSARNMLIRDPIDVHDLDRAVVIFSLFILRCEIDTAGYPLRWVRQIRTIVDTLIKIDPEYHAAH